MDHGMTPLREFGAAVAAAQDREATGAVDEARVRLFESAPSARPAWRMRWLAAALALGALVFAVAWGTRGPETTNLSFSVAGAPGTPESWLTVPDGASSSMSFSDGTQMWLSAGTRARVGALGSHGAEVHIERGGAHVAVVHRDETAWRFEAGPYDVFVTGTEFSVSWDPTQERFRIQMVEGSVEVAGPRIDGRRVLVAGQSLDLRATPPQAAAEPVATKSAPVADASPAALAPDTPDSTPATEAKLKVSPDARTSTNEADGSANEADGSANEADGSANEADGWRALASAGKYPEAYAAAAPAFDSILQSASASDLMVLADVARYAGQETRSRQAYRTLRSRFPGTSQAARAAFALGRSGDGAKWFSLYLRESPDGPLAREALGRLLESQRGQASGEATARRYLARYPDGPHALLARSIVDRD